MSSQSITPISTKTPKTPDKYIRLKDISKELWNIINPELIIAIVGEDEQKMRWLDPEILFSFKKKSSVIHMIIDFPTLTREVRYKQTITKSELRKLLGLEGKGNGKGKGKGSQAIEEQQGEEKGDNGEGDEKEQGDDGEEQNQVKEKESLLKLWQLIGLDYY